MYTLTRYSTTLCFSGDLAASPTINPYSPASREVVRKVKVLVTTALVGTSAVLTVKKRVTPGTDTGGTTIGTLTLPACVAGINYELKNLSTEIKPSEQLLVVLTTAMGTSGAGTIVVEMEQAPEVSGNDADTVVVTS